MERLRSPRYGARLIVSERALKATAQSAEAVQDSLARRQVVYGSWNILNEAKHLILEL